MQCSLGRILDVNTHFKNTGGVEMKLSRQDPMVGFCEYSEEYCGS